MKLTSVILCSLAVLCLLVGSANATLIMEVKAVPGPGYEVSADGKTVTVVDPAAVIAMQVWGTIPQSGADANATHYKLQSIYGGISASGLNDAAGTGALALDNTENINGYVAPFNTLSTPAFESPTLLGGAAGFTSTSTASLNYRAAALQTTAVIPGSWKVGMFNWRMTGIGPAGGQVASIQFNKPGAVSAFGTWLAGNIPQTPATANALQLALQLPCRPSFPNPAR